MHAYKHKHSPINCGVNLVAELIRREGIKNQTSVWRCVHQLVIGCRYRPLHLEL